ncbi:hypothetical protein DFH06DRAFT_1291448 [Mycena polygramma]|nr:hypothetical protein DFH06DRAFT_1291448 [Mycena polygramma]
MSSPYASLSALGAPLTLDEYTRLAIGPLADVLVFLSEHLVGRHAAATARTTLFQAQEAQAKSQLKQPATTRSRADKAVARLNSAKTSSSVHTKQLAEVQQKVDASAGPLTGLQRQLTTKRRLLLLLQVLDAKHTLQTQRIEALTQAINKLKHTPPQLLAVSCPALPTLPLQITPRVSHTRDRLADLHRLLSTPNPHQRLKRAVSHVLQMDPDNNKADAKLARVVEKCLASVQTHANAPAHPASSRKPSLDAKNQSNTSKTTSLQSLVTHAAALRLLCEGHLASISARTIGTPALRDGLQTDAHEVKGQVGRLAAGVLASAKSKSKQGGENKRETDTEESFARRVARTCKMPESATTPALLDEVRRVVRAAHRRRRLLDASLALAPVDVAVTPPRPVVNDRAAPAHAHAFDLLTRKGAKAALGRARADEVEGIIEGWRGVVGGGGGKGSRE